VEHRRIDVDPSLTFGVSLVVSLALWFGTFRGVMRGDVDVVDAGIRYLVALAISWAGVYGITVVFSRYNAQAGSAAGAEASSPVGDAGAHPLRRREDPAAEGAPDVGPDGPELPAA
jgi:hypothetical protein